MVRYSLLRTVLDPLLAVSGPGGLARLEFLPAAWEYHTLSLIHISEPTRPVGISRMPSSA